jgi:hypothetical protein
MRRTVAGTNNLIPPLTEKEGSENCTQSPTPAGGRCRNLESVHEGAAIVRASFHVSEGANLGFERLVVLAFDLQFGLQLLDQQIEVRDFDAQLMDV